MAAGIRRSHPRRALVPALSQRARAARLATAYRGDVGNAPLLALSKRAQHIQSDETVRKAHLRHGHDGPGGTLNPWDIAR